MQTPEVMQVLQAEFRTQAGVLIDKLQAEVDGVKQQSAKSMDPLMTSLNTLRGSAITTGFETISSLCLACEKAIHGLALEDLSANTELLSTLEEALSTMEDYLQDQPKSSCSMVEANLGRLSTQQTNENPIHSMLDVGDTEVTILQDFRTVFGRDPMVLIVDDDENIRDAMSQILESIPVPYIVSKNGHEAWLLIESSQVDLIITDYHMPLLNGLELIHRMKKHGTKGHVIVVSGHSDRVALAEAIQCGAFAYIQKPFSLAEISVQTLKALRKKSMDEARRRLALLNFHSYLLFNAQFNHPPEEHGELEMSIREYMTEVAELSRVALER